MNGRALIGAVVGGALGAGLWAFISHATGYEIGYVAWAIGLLVGGGAHLMGGSGQFTGVVCAGLALMAIFVGKLLAVQAALPSEIQKGLDEYLTHSVHKEVMKDAQDFADISDEEDYPAFMASHEYSDSDKAEDVTEEELADFTEYMVPRLTELHEEQPDYETWKRTEIEDAVAEYTQADSLAEIVKADLGLIDILFAFLGIGTAYKLGIGSDE